MNAQTKVLENRSVICSNGSKVFRVIKVFVKKKDVQRFIARKIIATTMGNSHMFERIDLRAMYASIPGELLHKEN